MLCVVCVVCVVVVVVLFGGRGVVWWSWCCLMCVCCGTLKKKTWETRVWVQKRHRVYIRNVPVYAGNTRTCLSTCVRGAGTHKDVLERTHGDVFESTHGWSSPVQFTKKSRTWSSHLATERSTKETNGSYPFSVREQIENNTLPIPPIIRFT